MQIVALLLDRRDETATIKLGDKIMETHPASALDRFGRHHGRQCNNRDRGSAGIFAKRGGKLEPVHLRHLDIGHHDVEWRAGFDRVKRLRGGPDRNDLISGGLDQRREQVAEKG